jgi:succinate dehydrogenase flavin-adding protein (antitoxin of CptAB toxin-antitoxin module)
MTSSDSTRDRLRERIRWHCRRGMLELDLVLNAFVERHFDTLDAREIEMLQALLAYPDPVLLELVMGHAEPEDPAESDMLALLRAVNTTTAA